MKSGVSRGFHVPYGQKRFVLSAKVTSGLLSMVYFFPSHSVDGGSQFFHRFDSAFTYYLGHSHRFRFNKMTPTCDLFTCDANLAMQWTKWRHVEPVLWHCSSTPVECSSSSAVRGSDAHSWTRKRTTRTSVSPASETDSTLSTDNTTRHLLFTVYRPYPSVIWQYSDMNNYYSSTATRIAASASLNCLSIISAPQLCCK